MGKFKIVSAVAIMVLLITILFSGCIRDTSVINNITSTPVGTEPTLRPNIASSDTLPASGHVYMGGRPATGISVVAVSINGSDRLLATTDDNGAYTLNIRPGTLYNFTAYNRGLKHTITPVLLHSTGKSEVIFWQLNDVADKYDIMMTDEHNSTIAGKTRPGWILVNASRIDGGPAVTNVSNYTGQYTLDVEPGIEYRLSGKDYYEELQFSQIIFYYRNGGPVESLSVGRDETVLIDMNSLQFAP